MTIYATDDQYIENSEQLVVTIDSDRARLMGEQEAIVTILDNDGMQLCNHGRAFLNLCVCVCVCMHGSLHTIKHACMNVCVCVHTCIRACVRGVCVYFCGWIGGCVIRRWLSR